MNKKTIKRDVAARIKHPILAIKFEILGFRFAMKAAYIKAMWDNYLFELAAEKAKEQQELIDKMVNLMMELYETDYYHVRVEINPNLKNGLGLYVND